MAGKDLKSSITDSRKSDAKDYRAGIFRIDRTQATIILCGLYLFFSLAGNIAATKVTYFGSLVMDAGFIYSLTFTWRDLIHKQLGKKAAITTIWLAAGMNLLAALYFQLVVLLPAQTDWANNGGQTAWAFLFGIIDATGFGWQSIFSLQMRIVLGSILTALIAELIDTRVYHIWSSGSRRSWPQWSRVFASNAVSIPVDSVLFPLIAFTGIVGAQALQQMVWTNIVVKVAITLLIFWTIYLVPEKPIYRDE
ncbi:Putative vitamin uptake transporter [uncultured archaeon]|nr:Putative vitamin uptake transporter [uncultured archaeon]